MADKSQAHDKQVLQKLGYAQELSRRMSGFSNFAISFSIIFILAGGISALQAAFNSAGPGGAFWIWLIGGALAMSVAWGMGQIASSFPTAGGLYHWSSHLGGKGWGWATAWFNLVGLICVVSSVDVLLYSVFFKDLLLGTVLGVDVSTFGYWHQFFFMVFVLTTGTAPADRARVGRALFEQLRIEVREGAIAYVALPAGAGAETVFPASEIAVGRAVFEAPAHDFPQRIEYVRQGDSLTATISDLAGARRLTWTFRREPGRP